MTDVFEEVEEEVRRDRYMQMMKRWGPWLAGFVILVLASVGGWTYYQNWQRQQAASHSEAFLEAQVLARAGDVDGAKQAFEALSNRGPRIYRQLAAMELAAIDVQNGDLEEALAKFDRIADEVDNDILRDTARMRAAYIVADTQDLASLRARLEPMIEEGGPFEYVARDLLGTVAWEAGEFELARETIAPLELAFEAPESVRLHARMLMAVLGPAQSGAETTETPEGAKDEAPAAPRGE